MRAVTSTLCFMLLWSVTAPLTVQSTPPSHCEPSLNPRTESNGYRLRGDRCEGTYIRDVSATLQLASFVERLEEFDLDNTDSVVIEWSLPRPAPIAIRAVGLRAKDYYQMDTSRPAESTSFQWPLDILRSLRLGARDIGVTGVTRMKAGSAELDVYVPMRVSRRGTSNTPGSYTATVVPMAEMEEIFVTLSSLDERGRKTDLLLERDELGLGYYPPERSVDISLNGLKEQGLYLLEIDGSLKTGGSDELTIFFYRTDR